MKHHDRVLGRFAVLWVGLALVLAVGTGCIRRYEIVLQDGSKVSARSRPTLDENGFYHYTNALKEPARIGAGRVREIRAR